MAKVIGICGKLCSGKTTYALELCKNNNAILLSVDELMLTLFDQHCGDLHDTYANRTKEFLCKKALELVAADVNVVLDWGFWKTKERCDIRLFFLANAVHFEMHYLEIDEATRSGRITKRNRAVLAKEASAYYVDENLASKVGSLFDAPGKEEIEVWIKIID